MNNWIFYTKKDPYSKSEFYTTKKCVRPEHTKTWKMLNTLLDDFDTQVGSIGYMTENEWLRAKLIEKIQRL